MTQFSQLVLIWLYINPEDMKNYKCFLVFTIFSCVYGKLPMENSESSLIIECSESKPDVIFKDRTIYPLPVSWKQSHFIEVAQGTIFMEQNVRFGLILGWLAILVVI